MARKYYLNLLQEVEEELEKENKNKKKTTKILKNPFEDYEAMAAMVGRSIYSNTSPTVNTTNTTTKVENTIDKKEETPWYKQLFNDTYLKDGYQFGDLSKTAIDTTGKTLSLFGAEKLGNTLQQNANSTVNNVGNTFKNIGEGITNFGSTLAYGMTEGIGQMGTTISENIPYTLSNKVATKKDIEDYETKNKITSEKKKEIIDNYIKEYGDIDKATTELANLHVNKKDTLDNLKFAKFDKVAEMISKEYVEAKKQNPKLTLDKYKEQVEKELKEIEYARDILQEQRGRKPFTDSASESLKAGLDLLGIGEFVNDFKEELKTPFNQVREWGQKAFGEGAQEFQEKHEFAGGITQSIGQLLPTIATVAITKNPTAGTAIFATSAKGGYYEDYIARGYTTAEAESASNFMTAVEVGSEFIGGALGGVNIFKKGSIAELAKKPVAQTIKSLGVEGTEELIAELGSLGVDLDLGEDVTLEEAGERLGTAFASGVVLGAVMKGAGVAGSKAQNIAERITRGEQVTEAEVIEALGEVAEQNETTVEGLLEQETNAIMQQTQEQSDQIIQEYEQKSTDVVNELNQKADEVLNKQETEQAEKNEAPQAEISDVSEQSQQVIFPEVETAQNEVIEPNKAIEENIPIETAQNVSESQKTEENVAESEINNIELTDEEQYSVNNWKGADAYKINERLRNGTELTPELQKTADDMSAVMKKLPTVEDTVYRSIDLQGDKLNEFLEKYKQGNVVEEKAFTSASTGQIYDDTMNIQMEIVSHTARDTSKLMRADENEVMFDRGSKFKVLEVDTTDPNNIKVKLEDVTETEAKQKTPTKTEKNNITIDNEVNDFHSGETFSTMTAKIDGKVAGTLEYSEYEGKPSVKMVEVSPEYRRKGVGTKLLQELQKAYPNTEIDFGMLTDDGAKLINKSTYEVENKELADKFARKEELQKIIDEYDKTIEESHENDTDLPEGYAEDYNELYDELQDLEKELRGKKATKRLVRETPTEAEIDNLIKMQEKGGSEYAKAFYEAQDKYGTTQLYKALNEGYKRAKNQDIAPVAEQVEEAIAPLQETITDLTEQVSKLTDLVENAALNNATLAENVADTTLEQQVEANNEPTDIVEDTTPDYEDDKRTTSEVKSPFEDRDIKEVGNRKVKAYMYENPEVKPYFQEAANQMLGDLKNTIKGERIYNPQLAYEEGQADQNGAFGWVGMSRQTTSDIAYLKDNFGYTYGQIEEGLNKIIEDNGLENNAVSKRIEFMLDERLKNGYADVSGMPIPANQDYIKLLEQKQITEYNSNRFAEMTDEQLDQELARNTVQTTPEANTDSQGRTISKELQEELKDSVVRDEQGRLLTVYHGSPNAEITEFDATKAGSNTLSDFTGIYFTDSQIVADDFSYEQLPGNSNLTYKRGKKGKVYENYLNITSPLDLNNLTNGDIDGLSEFIDTSKAVDGIEKALETMKLMNKYKNAQGVKFHLDLEAIKDSGKYDGIIADMGSQYKGSNEYIVFDSKQIKTTSNNETIAPVTPQNANTDTLTTEATPDIPIAENTVETVQEDVETTIDNTHDTVISGNEVEAPKLKVREDLAPTQETTENIQQQWNEDGEIVDTETIEKKTRKEIQDKLIEEAGIVKENLDNAKDISKVLMHNTDPIRLQEIIFGKEIGGKINDGTFYVVKHNTAEKIRFQNQERDEIKELGIKPRSKKSAAVQKYGEKQYVNEVGETVAYKDAELAAEFPDIKTQEKIKNAAKVIRQKYDNYIDRTNEVLTKLGYDPIPKRQDYMRHFQELNDIFSMYGLPFNMQSAQANDLPVDINGLTADLKPGKNWFASALKRTGNKTTYDAITGIDGYIEGIGNLIYHTEDIQRLRGFENYVREMYGQEHGFDNLDNLSEEEKAVRIQQIQNNHLGNYAAWLREYTNTLAGKKAMVDRAVEDIFGRRVYSFLNELKSQVGSNMTGLNIGSALTNPISMTQALAKTNKLATVKGYADTIKNIFVKDNFVEQNDFLTARFGSDILSPTAWQKMRNAGQIFMTGTDWFASNSITRSKFYELKAKGLSDAEAHKQAGDFAARILGDRSQGATPTLYNSKMLGLVTQFQLEVNNQLYSQFYDTFSDAKQTAKEKGVLKAAVGATFVLGQLAAYQHIYNNLYEAIAGRRPAFDIISIIATALGLGLDDDEEKKPLGDRLYEAADMLVDSLPYVSTFTGGGRIPISEALPISELFSGKDQYGNDKSRLETLSEALPYYFLPTGYGQIKKTVSGVKMYDEDLPIAGSYTDGGNLRFTAEEDAWSKIQAGLFGQWANKNAKDYIDSEFKTVDKENIDELMELGYTAKEYNKYKSGLNEIKKMDLKDGEARATYLFDYIESLNATDKQKGTMIRNLLSEQEQKDVYDKLEMSSEDIIEYYDAKSSISQQVAEYTNNKNLLTGDTESEEYKEAVGSLSNEKKANIIDTILSANLTDEQKAYLYGKYYSSDKTLDKVLSSGVAMDDYLTFSKDSLSLEDTYEKVDYLYNASLTDNAKRVLYETSVLSGYDNEEKYKDYKTAKAAEIDINSWLSYKKQEFKADKDKYGDSITGTRKRKIINYINSLNLSIPQKAIMIRTEYESFDDYNYDIVKYVDGLDTTYDAKVSILDNLGMVVDSNGSVSW